ncbi:hypothetical protein R1sor_001249 [Riccia sorocarpa]|uniref:MULE transposase domain-containing protein n=1 Tax=Riccia sorocarpa TaxID=122646 RepID=A0ABD3GYJ5_9MARC
MATSLKSRKGNEQIDVMDIFLSENLCSPMVESTGGALRSDEVFPLVFILLPNKQKESYIRAMRLLLEKNPRLDPETIMIDFEIAEINAFKNVFPSARLRGCYFHFGQCIWRKIQSLGPLLKRYQEDATFAFIVKKLNVLAFLPPVDIERGFEMLVDRQNASLLSPLLDYFQDTWVGRPMRYGRTRHAPTFAVQLWNQYHKTLEGLPRTNNSVEGWHKTFSSLMSSSYHLEIYRDP